MQTPCLGFAARSGTGKTTLLRAILPLLESAGLRIGMIKHAHHAFDVDQPGKDSYELRKAGARQMLVASDTRWALMTETPDRQDPLTLDELLGQLNTGELDLILVEGFRQAAFPKIELYRPSLGQPPLYAEDPYIIAVATDGTLPGTPPDTVLDINAPDEIASYIRARLVHGTGKEGPP